MRRGKEEDDEVEQLLQAAQDEMILKLSVDSHASRSRSDYLDPDLHSRFLALRSKPSQQQKKTTTTTEQKRRPVSPTKSKDAEETPDDLMLRFAALKIVGDGFNPSTKPIEQRAQSSRSSRPRLGSRFSRYRLSQEMLLVEAESKRSGTDRLSGSERASPSQARKVDKAQSVKRD
ncbi:hypothetical protein IGI04_001412 [Brassica rapa subsp. trilocularis]|uniref:Uncharacterized protein n=1 Tax=Brassica rapa subsp. trilocularis TaxID=1813537 RepID=A0ABQ7NUR6_BRACM|nr:hypothetical protein IGI04_001412 [Brassica rapa subsp. trilocularis]